MRNCCHRTIVRFQSWNTLCFSLIDMRASPALFVRRTRLLIVLEIWGMKPWIVQCVGQECRWTDQTDSVFWNTWAHISFSTALLVIIHRSCVVSASIRHQCVGSTWKRDMAQLQVTISTSTVQLASGKLLLVLSFPRADGHFPGTLSCPGVRCDAQGQPGS